MPSPTVDLLLRSDLILTPSGIVDGHLATSGDRVVALAAGAPDPDLLARAGEVLDLAGHLVTPGFIDVHTFFPGWFAEREGLPVEESASTIARRADAADAFAAYQAMLHARGVTTVKEMVFDTGGGVPELLAGLEARGHLTLGVHVMSQPVDAPLDLATADRLGALLTGPRLRFSGFNVMTDGSLGDREAELLAPYADGSPGPRVDWAGIERAVLAADAAGHRVALHAQGDGAVRRSVDLLERCRRGPDGRLVLRHALTDLEMAEASDLARLARLGAVAEVYPQITSRRTRAEAAALVDAAAGADRRGLFWQRRALADAGATIACATDLPLLVPDVPAAVLHACWGRFADGGAPLVPDRTLRPEELLHAWTAGGAWDLGTEAETGALTVGRRADIAVLDADVLTADPDRLGAVRVALTVAGGRVVHRA